jgi:hypothetical protein
MTIQAGATGVTVRWLQYLLDRRTVSYTQTDGALAGEVLADICGVPGPGGS